MRRRAFCARYLLATTAFAVAPLLLGAGSASAAEWPTKPVTIMVPFNPGGSVDRMARSIATYMSKEVGQPITVVNRPGAGGQMGLTVALSKPADGSNLIVTAAIPYAVNNILTGGAEFTLDDFQHVNAQWIANGAFMIHKDAPYKSMEDLITAIRDNPGEVSAGVIGQSAEHLTILLLLDALDIPKANLRLVTFDGGGPTRTAVAGGQVDFGVITAQGSESILDNVNVAAIIADEPIEGWDVPLLQDELTPYDITLPRLQSSVRSMMVDADFPKENPEVYEAFVDAYKRTLEREDYKAFAKEAGIETTWRGPERSDKIVRESFGALKEHAPLLEN